MQGLRSVAFKSPNLVLLPSVYFVPVVQNGMTLDTFNNCVPLGHHSQKCPKPGSF